MFAAVPTLGVVPAVHAITRATSDIGGTTAPPGWVDPSIAVPSSAQITTYSQSWTSTSYATSSRVHGIGPSEYVLQVVPLDEQRGDLYTATMRFSARQQFRGILSADGMGGGSGGQFVGWSWLRYNSTSEMALNTTRPYFGDGAGADTALLHSP